MAPCQCVMEDCRKHPSEHSSERLKAHWKAESSARDMATGQSTRPDRYFSQTPEGSFMSRSSYARCLLTCLVLCALLALSPHAAQTPRDATSADARLRALYTEEWNWR